MSILIAIEGWDTGVWEQRMRRVAPEREIRVYPRDRNTAGVKYALCWNPPRGLLGSMPDIELILSLGAGVDHLLSDPDLPDVPILRVVDPSLTTLMTEWVVLQVLYHHRQVRDYDAQKAQKVWNILRQPAGSRVGVGLMGLGVLGRDAADKLAHLGFDVAGWSRTPRDIPGIACFHGQEGLDQFLARTDILVSLLPLTPETNGLIDYSLLAKLKRDNHMGGAVLINAGRGKQQVEADILRALADQTLSGASLDVFETEPLPPSSPLWNHPRVTITPHAAAESDPDYLCGYALEQIERHERGEAPQNVIDQRRGY